MVITYHGIEYIRVQFGDTTLAFNPISKSSKYKSSTSGADIVLVSLNHPDMNGIESVSRGEKQPFVINGPGAYEVRGIAIEGFASTSRYGATKKEILTNTIYLVSLEGMMLCYLGALGDAALPQAAQEAIDEVDILFVPIGGEGVLSPLEAHKLSVQLEPHIVIPIHYGEGGEKNALSLFLKEEGVKNERSVEKLTIKKKEVEGKEGDVVIVANVS